MAYLSRLVQYQVRIMKKLTFILSILRDIEKEDLEFISSIVILVKYINSQCRLHRVGIT